MKKFAIELCLALVLMLQQHEAIFSYKIRRNAEPARSIVDHTYLLKHDGHGIVRAQFAR